MSIIHATTMPSALRTLLEKGEFISMIKPNTKPNFKNFTFVSSKSFSGALHRMMHGENRKELMIEINNITDQFIVALNDRSNDEFQSVIVDVLSRMSKVGLTNLMETYTYSPKTIAELRVCINSIELQLAKFHIKVIEIPKPIDPIEIETKPKKK